MSFTRRTLTLSTRLPSIRVSSCIQLQYIPRSRDIRHFQTSRTLLEAPRNPYRDEESPAPKVIRGQSKVYKNADEAVADVKSGSTILSAGFGLCGTAEGKIAIELCPQGTIAERLRAGGAGIPAFYTPTGVNYSLRAKEVLMVVIGTLLQTGGIPTRLGPPDEGSKENKVLEKGQVRETREFDGKTYSMEKAIKGDVAILRAWKVDEAGNCQFRYTTRTFGPIMAKAAKVAIVEAENIVPIGSIAPADIHLPGIYIDRIVPATVEKKLELKTTRRPEGQKGDASSKSDANERRDRIARRTAKELKNGYYVNLGVGLPTLAPSFLSPETKVWIQSENGILGMVRRIIAKSCDREANSNQGPYPTDDEVDPDIINAGKETVTLVPGASTFDSAESFAMIRGGHIDVSVLGALQVGANGDLANYMIPGKIFKGMGGAMDLVSNPDETKIVVATEHVAKDGSPKIVQNCSLPLTGAKVVSTIITDLCVFEVDRANGGLTLTELAPGVEIEEVQKKTDAKFKVADEVRSME
ncbi:hypothetical protein CJF30_00002807 [Rutstroemia sp. NJR-2017a BBW]|nr:hypothetical protein CJF30_00002807 [Rutstroemia sp. NJR-2017a BBW]